MIFKEWSTTLLINFACYLIVLIPTAFVVLAVKYANWAIRFRRFKIIQLLVYSAQERLEIRDDNSKLIRCDISINSTSSSSQTSTNDDVSHVEECKNMVQVSSSHFFALCWLMST